MTPKTRDAMRAMPYGAAMRLPQIQSNTAVMFIAAAITIVTWIIVVWPGRDTRRIPVEPSVTYVDINMKDRSAQPAPTPPAP